MSSLWQNILHQNLSIQLHRKRLSMPSNQVFPFYLEIGSVEKFQAKQGCIYRAELCFFDFSNNVFFGRPFCTSWARTVSEKLSFSEAIFFYTTFKEVNIAVKLQLVERNEHNETRCVGWSVLDFIYRYDELPDTSDPRASSKILEVDLFHGSPKALLLLKEMPQRTKEAQKFAGGVHISYVANQHRRLLKVLNFIPEHTFIGSSESVPGLADPEGGIHLLLDPAPKSFLQATISKLMLSFPRSKAAFEEIICKLMNRNRLVRDNRPPDNKTMFVLERRIHVGIHNGWTYTQKPQVLHVSEQVSPESASLGRNKAKPRFRALSLETGSKTDSNLFLRQKLELHELSRDPGIAIVFVLEYMIAFDDKRSQSTQRSVKVAWVAWSPFGTDSVHRNVSLPMSGGAGRNPDDILFLKTSAPSSSMEIITHHPAPVLVQFEFNLEKQPSIDTRQSSQHLLQVKPSGAEFNISNSPEPYYQIPHSSSQQPSVPKPGPFTVEQKPTSLDPSASRSSSTPSQSTNYQITPLDQPSSPAPPTRTGRPPLSEGRPNLVPYNDSIVSVQQKPMILSNQHLIPAHSGHLLPIVYNHNGQSAFVTTFPGLLPLSQSSFLMPEMKQLQTTTSSVRLPVLAQQLQMVSCTSIPRQAFAVLHKAEFPAIVSHQSQTPETVDVASPVPLNLNLELNDPLRCNEIVLQFMAFARAEAGNELPRSVFLTFQFYRFPQINTEQLLLSSTESRPSGSVLPYIFRRMDNVGSLIQGAPGYQVKFVVDTEFLNAGESQTFLKFLFENHLHIDVWDADALMLIGSCNVPARILCRNGKPAVQCYLELPVLTTELSSSNIETPEGYIHTDSPDNAVHVLAIMKGKLYLKLANIGYPPTMRLNNRRIEDAALTLRNPAVVSQTLFRLDHRRSAQQPPGKFVAKAEQLKCDTVIGLNSIWNTSLQSELTEDAKDNEERRRKLQRMNTFRKLEKIANFALNRPAREDLLRELDNLKSLRNQRKHPTILAALLEAITTIHTVFPSLGTAEFFEFLLRNPFNEPVIVSIEITDPELKLVSNSREWQFFKQLHNLMTPLDEALITISVEQKENSSEDQKLRIFLKPRENAYVPFKFQTFAAFESPQPMLMQPNTEGRHRVLLKSKTIKAFFKHEKTAEPIAVLLVEVEPQPQPVHQVFRFNQPEDTVFSKFIRVSLPSSDGFAASVCSDPHVICECHDAGQGSMGTQRFQDVFLKVCCGKSPQLKAFSVMLFADEFLSRPAQVWQCFVHAQKVLSVSALQGQTSKFSLVLKGDDANRMVKLYSALPSELCLEPKDPFLLQAKTTVEVKGTFRPLKTGTNSIQVTAVDVELRSLLNSWIVCTTTQIANISKAFQVKLHAGINQIVQKKLTFKNPYSVHKTFTVSSSQEHLVSVKETVLNLEPHENATIHLRFEPQETPLLTEVFLFISDEKGNSEETFGIKLMYIAENHFLRNGF